MGPPRRRQTGESRLSGARPGGAVGCGGLRETPHAYGSRQRANELPAGHRRHETEGPTFSLTASLARAASGKLCWVSAEVWMTRCEQVRNVTARPHALRRKVVVLELCLEVAPSPETAPARTFSRQDAVSRLIRRCCPRWRPGCSAAQPRRCPEVGLHPRRAPRYLLRRHPDRLCRRTCRLQVRNGSWKGVPFAQLG